MTDALDTAVAELMRRVAAEIVMPRYRHLSAAQVEEKSPGDLVTIADREAEVALTDGLLPLIPGARVIGEEATAADATLLDGIAEGTVWIVDPIDGTGNFAAGHEPFGIMVALADGGTVQAAWLLDPVNGRLCHARLGSGAFIDGARIAARGTGEPLPVTAIGTSFMNAAERERVERRAEGRLTHQPIPRCAAEQYPRLVTGVCDLALFHRTLPWDHAPGALFVQEAGGHVARPDGSPYRIGDQRTGLMGASSPAMWDRGAEVLFG